MIDETSPPTPPPQSMSVVKRGRKLKNDEDVFTQNAWDDTEWTEEMYREAEKRLQEQKDSSKYYRKDGGCDEDNDDDDCVNNIAELESNVTIKWDNFYLAHEDKFFKDRKWIFSEFPELCETLRVNSPPCNIFEAGCGVGNAVVHILTQNNNPHLHIYCCDLSQNAIDTLKRREFYQSNCSRVSPFQANICTNFTDIILKHITPNSLDYIMLIFTMSALKPELMRTTVMNLAKLVKPGGMFLFRDYARYDLTQLRFKGSALLRDNYYIRSDGTTSYFFTQQEVDEIFTQQGETGLVKVELKQDNRMLVNRLKGIKMCRCWIQAKYKKAHAQ